MIIQSSQVALSSSVNASSQLSEKASQQKIIANSATNAPQQMRYQRQDRFDYSQQLSQKFQTSSRVIQANQEQHFAANRVTSDLVALSLQGQSAQLATLQAFAADDREAFRFSGEVQIRMQRQLQFQSYEANGLYAKGQVLTADGRAIEFDLLMQSQNSTRISAETQASLSLQAMHDPLVINFGRDSVQLKNTLFQFDLTGKGEASYASLASGSGYLMLDLNGDGRVSDGSELFGTRSGKGFDDLALYDEDGNGWIDEQDSVFQRLQLWTDQSDPTQTLALAEAGVGAIYLGYGDQSQSLRTEQGALAGQVSAAGMVLVEDGQLRSVQAVDLMAQKTERDLESSLKMDQKMQSMAEQMNVSLNAIWQGQQKMSWNLSANSNPWQESASAGKEAKDFFTLLKERIEKMVAERKALLDKITQRYQQ